MVALTDRRMSYACEARFKHVYQLKITLQHIKPALWRRIQVPEIYTFWDLHVAITDCMPWADSHLHVFQVVDPTFHHVKHDIGIPPDDLTGLADDDELTLPCWAVDIAPYFTFKRPKVRYLYDFGDGWEHFLRLEKILPREHGVAYPQCVGGKRACPPEDCGGPTGYGDLLRTLADPGDEQHQELLDWVGGSFDPNAFSIDDVQFDDPEKRWRIAFRGEEPDPGMRIDRRHE